MKKWTTTQSEDTTSSRTFFWRLGRFLSEEDAFRTFSQIKETPYFTGANCCLGRLGRFFIIYV